MLRTLPWLPGALITCVQASEWPDPRMSVPCTVSRIKGHLLGCSLPGLDLADSSSSVHSPLPWDQQVVSPSPASPHRLPPRPWPCLQCLSQSRCSRVWEDRGREGPLSLALLALSVSLIPEILGNATSLRVVEGQSLRLVCVVDSNPPTRISWARGCLTVSPSQPLDPGVLELPHVVLGDGGELTCQTQHPRGSLRVSLNLVVQGNCISKDA